MKLVVAEKPSVARSIADVLEAGTRRDGFYEGGGYLVSWCIGHLVELCPPEHYHEKYRKWDLQDLPIVPDPWQYTVSPATGKQFRVLKTLMDREDVESLVCATDAGREGEHIFRLVYSRCGCQKPVERLWISSLEDSAIRAGFARLRPGEEYDALYEAALCRDRADWLVGINGTRLFSALYGGQVLNVGRVMTPTLAMAVRREAERDAFRPEPFYRVELSLEGFTAVSERKKDRRAAEALREQCRDRRAVVEQVETRERTEHPPALYDLTGLQRDANRLLGFTAQQTLEYTQSLYEKKLVTYPRTDSRYLTEDMEGKIPRLVDAVLQCFPVEGGEKLPVFTAQVINGKKVSDHHAILPTAELNPGAAEALPKGEREILHLIADRLLCAVGEPFRWEETKVVLSCAGATFKAGGKTVLNLGWKALERKEDTEKTEARQDTLPRLAQGQEPAVRSACVKEGRTTPPKHFTEDTLLAAMETAGAEEMPEDAERKGLGTPATRAATIEKLVNRGFLERRGDKKTRHLLPTPRGTALIGVLPEQICSPSMTADWEEKLRNMERNQYSGEQFMGEIREMLTDLVTNYRPSPDRQGLTSAVGVCPLCGGPVEERGKGYFCGQKPCGFALWKNNRYFESIGKSLTAPVVEKLLGDGRVKLRRCKSRRTGNTFDAVVVMTVGDRGRPEFKLEFEGRGKGTPRTR